MRRSAGTCPSPTLAGAARAGTCPDDAGRGRVSWDVPEAVPLGHSAESVVWLGEATRTEALRAFEAARPGAQTADLPLTAVMRVELRSAKGNVAVEALTEREQPISSSGARWAFGLSGERGGQDQLTLVAHAKLLYGTAERAQFVQTFHRSLRVEVPGGIDVPEAGLNIGVIIAVASTITAIVGLPIIGLMVYRRRRRAVLMLTFANDEGSARLKRLNAERIAIQETLVPLVESERCVLVVESEVSTARLFDLIERHDRRMVGFHYGGHADEASLRFRASDGQRGQAWAEGLARALATAPRLRFVFLNGCDTAGVARSMHEHLRIPVIATHGAIDDGLAQAFAGRFYRALGQGRSLQAAFDWAEAELLANLESPDAAWREDVRLLFPGKAQRSRYPWALICHAEAPDGAGWSLV